MNFKRPTELGLTLLMLGAAAAGARAQERPLAPIQNQDLARVDLDIPALPLGDALAEFGRQTGLHMVMDAQLGQGRSSGRVRGRYTLHEALGQFLANTGLSYQYLDEQTIMLALAGTHKPAADVASFVAESIRLSQEGAEAAPPAETAAGGAQEQDGELGEVVVRGVQFRYDKVMSVNKMPMSVKDTPQSVKLITQDLIEFSGIRKFEDLYKVDASSGSSNAGDQFPRNYYRGFATQGVNAVKVDGFRVTGNIQLDLAPFESFEVVKGATSTLYGQNSVGGTLNAISKMPKKEFGGALTFESGSYNHYRGDLDLYGPLTVDGNLSYRLVSAYQDEESYVDFVYDRRVVVAPTLKYDFNENTSVMLRVNYQHSNFMPYYGFGAQFLGDDLADSAQLTTDNFRLPDVPASRSGSSPGSYARKQIFIAQTVFDHRMGQWTLRGNLQYARTRSNLNGVYAALTDRDGFTDTSIYHTENKDSVYAGEVNLYGDVEILGRNHTLFFGADDAKLENDVIYLSNVQPGFSIIHPDYELLRFPARKTDYEFAFFGPSNRRMSGVTAQALLRPLDGLTVSLGTRYSHDVLENQSACCDLSAALGEVDQLKANAFTYQGGLTYALTPSLNAYAGYGTTFEPQNAFVALNKRIDPQEGTSYEVGLKGDVPGHRLSYSVALFHMDRTNLIQYVPGSPFVRPVGTQASEGVEIDFQGEVLKGWEVYGSLALMDPKYTEGEHKGAQPANAAKRGVSLFTSYEIQSGQLRGLGFGGGVVYKSGRHTNDFVYGANTPITFLRDFTEASVRVFYSRAQWQFDLGVANLFDDRYYSVTGEQLAVGYQANAPRTVMGSVRYRF